MTWTRWLQWLRRVNSNPAWIVPRVLAAWGVWVLAAWVVYQLTYQRALGF